LDAHIPGRGNEQTVGSRPDPADVLQRVWVLLLFTVAPLLPGYRGVRIPLAVLVVALFAGCAWNTPPATVHQPMTARAAPPRDLYGHSGAIFQPETARLALFADNRARWVGDTITILMQENTSASKKSSGAANRTGSTNLEIPVYSNNLPLAALQGTAIEASSGINFQGNGNAASNNAFTGQMAVTVIEVLENGNLLVSGEKQVTINQGTEFIRFSGVINPAYIQPNNSVSSTRVADARLEYRSTGYISEAQTMGWLSRFFMSVLPF
jgi:flagellar L-ring protein precursor FlgH